ncbi:MAG: GNAT family N-acetyltransferase [Elusimicrobia bacterium]|nr:GNAT family N-acetyltransferase [Elusimicrobiota bacterium]
MIEKFQSFNPLHEAINKNNYLYYLIKADNNVAGYIGLHEEDGKMFLSKLYILKEYRGKSVSSKAFEFIENLAKEKKLKSVWLTVNKNNNHAIEVYKHRGFVVIRKQVADIGNGFVMDDYVFEKVIK